MADPAPVFGLTTTAARHHTSGVSRGAARVSPEEFILSVLSPEDRVEAAFAVAREAFRGSTLTLDDIAAAVRKVRRRRVSAGRRGRAGRR
jgi:hypothetical protein